MKTSEIISKTRDLIYKEINIMSKSNPVINFAQPFIMKIIDNKKEKISNFLGLFAEENGEINIDELINEVIQRLNSTNSFTVDLMSFSKAEIGEGRIKLSIPLTDKYIVFNTNDIQIFKDTILNQKKETVI